MAVVFLGASSYQLSKLAKDGSMNKKNSKNPTLTPALITLRLLASKGIY